MDIKRANIEGGAGLHRDATKLVRPLMDHDVPRANPRSPVAEILHVGRENMTRDARVHDFGRTKGGFKQEREPRRPGLGVVRRVDVEGGRAPHAPNARDGVGGRKIRVGGTKAHGADVNGVAGSFHGRVGLQASTTGHTLVQPHRPTIDVHRAVHNVLPDKRSKVHQHQHQHQGCKGEAYAAPCRP